MKQLAQKLKDGTMSVLDVPVPEAGPGRIVVLNHYSLISAGTEGGTVSAARKSVLGKARERPQQVKQVLESLRQQGPVQTYRAVMKKLDAYSPLGYSTAGEVIDVGEDVVDFSVGDRVACAGAGYASHAEIVAVPRNLCVKLPADAPLDRAAYNTVGAIAMQGVRQAGLCIGESCLVIGLGLLGQLSCLILRASGVFVIGIDIDTAVAGLAGVHAADFATTSDDPELPARVLELTGGIGADAAIIAAATSSLQPVNQAGELVRKRGTVVVVGAVPTGFDREPHYYRKELSLKMSCSYGPGRYDPNYEEGGHDYPPGYVRWTENRNMRAFQDLVYGGRIDVDYLTTHRFRLDQAENAYRIILGRSEPVLGILLEYDAAAGGRSSLVELDTAGTGPEAGELGVAFIGAGSYAMGHLLPAVASTKGVRLSTVVTNSGTSARSAAERFGFKAASTAGADVMGDDGTRVVFIATRHDSHAEYVCGALRAGKHVFVEKPLCLSAEELAQIGDAFTATDHRSVLLVGFNRRFSPLAEDLKSRIGPGPKAMMFRVNAGRIPPESWIHARATGGGRIIGEACHFVDFMIFLTGSLPRSVYAAAMEDAESLEDTVVITLRFADGSVGTISYFANGSRRIAKEYVEVYRAGTTAILDDFRKLKVFSNGKPYTRSLAVQNKGQAEMVASFFDAIKDGGGPPIATEELFATARITFEIVDSLRTGRVCKF